MDLWTFGGADPSVASTYLACVMQDLKLQCFNLQWFRDLGSSLSRFGCVVLRSSFFETSIWHRAQTSDDLFQFNQRWQKLMKRFYRSLTEWKISDNRSLIIQHPSTPLYNDLKYYKPGPDPAWNIVKMSFQLRRFNSSIEIETLKRTCI